jgi:hypothetical protein
MKDKTMTSQLQRPSSRIVALLAFAFALPLAICAQRIDGLTASQRRAIDQVSQLELRARLAAHFADVVASEKEGSGSRAASTVQGQQPVELRLSVQEEKTDEITQLTYRDEQSGRTVQVSRRKFADDDEEHELKSEGFDVHFDQSGHPSGLFRRDGNEVLALYTNGLPRSYSCNIGSNLWYHVVWSADGTILTERTAGRPKVIGRVGAR